MPPEPLLLAFDTSAAHCAAALLCGERLLAARTEPMARGQAERLLPLLEEVLAEGGAGWPDLAGLGVCIGPGNFTGVRISVATARGLSLSLGRPAIGVSRLEALAFGLPGPVLALVDARQERLYAQLFGAGESAPRMTDADTLAAEAWPEGLTVTGAGAAALAARLGARAAGESDAPAPEALARLALARLGQPAPRPAPLYLRPADAALPSEKPPAILP
ncbi:tRNA (adenosine(37)-N6)-threonylcarbamoyltransferase complex dimerization subunit type 1 TsaB [Oceanicella sp. SM1341]|uniref:tRNA (adenosine(37)-N6)-threonylcarbamoyltransferase complex dimerization subunit type 1 TsaB n=1 Tax=Oceanicella sp. SM1341 TaxID=1548889 RepID=UPI000E53CC5F|nr:tRNA (adenosine(37)-N6)-threonylcarbamoyltransferase complex dimerization subunit type 1 TsaB [Oceanicella sp. SM1341]